MSNAHLYWRVTSLLNSESLKPKNKHCLNIPAQFPCSIVPDTLKLCNALAVFHFHLADLESIFLNLALGVLGCYYYYY